MIIFQISHLFIFPINILNTMNLNTNIFGAYETFLGKEFLQRFRRIFDNEFEYKKYNFNFVCKLLKKKCNNDEDILLLTLKNPEFWKEIEDVQRSYVSFDEGEGFFYMIARHFFNYFLEFMDSKIYLHRRIDKVVKTLFPERSKSEIEKFLENIHLSEQDKASTHVVSSDGSVYEDATSSSPIASSPVPLVRKTIKILPSLIKNNKTVALRKESDDKVNENNSKYSNKQTSDKISKAKKNAEQSQEEIAFEPRITRNFDKIKLLKVVEIEETDKESQASENLSADQGNNEASVKNAQTEVEDARVDNIQTEVEDEEALVDDFEDSSQNSEKNSRTKTKNSKAKSKSPEPVLSSTLIERIDDSDDSFVIDQTDPKEQQKETTKMIGITDLEGSIVRKKLKRLLESGGSIRESAHRTRSFRKSKKIHDSETDIFVPETSAIINQKKNNRKRIKLGKANQARSAFYSEEDIYLSDDETIPGVEELFKRKPDNRNGDPYKEKEDIKILRYIITNNLYDQINGRLMWQEMSRDFKNRRTWQSLKERFLHRILRDVDSLSLLMNLPDDVIDLLHQMVVESKVSPSQIKNGDNVNVRNNENDDDDDDNDSDDNEIAYKNLQNNSTTDALSFSEPDLDKFQLQYNKRKFELSDSDDDFSKVSRFSVNKKVPYSSKEDDDILNFVFNVQKPFSPSLPLTGNLYWKHVEKKLKETTNSHRTWESIKSRFKTYIVPKMHLSGQLQTEEHRVIAEIIYKGFYKSEYKVFLSKYDRARKNPG